VAVELVEEGSHLSRSFQVLLALLYALVEFFVPRPSVLRHARQRHESAEMCAYETYPHRDVPGGVAGRDGDGDLR
jgi:hypothetical protein